MMIFWKWAFRLHESFIFEGRGRQNPSKMPPEIDQKNDAFFRWKNMETMCKKATNMTPKSLQNRSKKEGERAGENSTGFEPESA